jgi:hypothetical protein
MLRNLMRYVYSPCIMMCANDTEREVGEEEEGYRKEKEEGG